MGLMSDQRLRLFRELFIRHSHELLRLLTRRVGIQDAPDVLQETYLRVLRQTDGETIAEPYAFLQTTAINLAKDHRRRLKTEQKYLEFGTIAVDLPAANAAPDYQIEADQRLTLLLLAVEKLPPRCRQVFIMRRFENLHQEEIARRLGISRNMVEKHLRLALARLRATLD
jgi:RNA polymerase sigma-70 factor (ECF subfamily)